MAYVPPFLQALELDADADERAIRRAYAQRLKRLDPEADPEAFQALREVFEAALKWVEQPEGARVVRVMAVGSPPAPRPARAPVAAPTPSDAAARIEMPAQTTGAFSWAVDDAKDAAPAADASGDAAKASPAPVPVPARAVDVPPAPAPAARAMPSDAERPGAVPVRAPAPPPRRPTAASPVPVPVPAPARAAVPRPPARQLSIDAQADPADLVFADFADRFARTASDEADTTRLLREALADDRLVNLEARTRFEGRVAHLLAGGWRVGHEHLFKPASDVFEWETDRRRLEVFGQDGQVLDAAVRERLIFFAQPAVAFEAQKALIRRLRKDRPIATPALGPEIKLLAMLMQRFPNWMRVMTRAEVVQHWIDAWNALPDDVPAPAAAPAHPVRRAATQAGRASGRPGTRIPPVAPPASTWATTTTRSSFGGFGGGGFLGAAGARWMVAAFIAGALRLFGSLGHASHPAPADPAPYAEPVIGQSQTPPTQADAIRALAARAQPSAMPDPSTQPFDPIEAARQQRQQDATARRQAEIDQRYQEILQSRQAKQALRAQPGEQVIAVPDGGGTPGQ